MCDRERSGNSDVSAVQTYAQCQVRVLRTLVQGELLATGMRRRHRHQGRHFSTSPPPLSHGLPLGEGRKRRKDYTVDLCKVPVRTLVTLQVFNCPNGEFHLLISVIKVFSSCPIICLFIQLKRDNLEHLQKRLFLNPLSRICGVNQSSLYLNASLFMVSRTMS